MANEIKEFNQPEESNQSEPEKAENVDNRLPYEAPKLRKHGKLNDATKLNPVFGSLDNPFNPFLSDMS